MTLYADYISPDHKDWNKVLNSVINNRAAFNEWIDNEVMDPRYEYVGLERANNILDEIINNYKFDKKFADNYEIDADITIVVDGSKVVDVSYDIYDWKNNTYIVPADVQKYYDKEMTNIAKLTLQEYNKELEGIWNGTYDNYNYITYRVETFPVYFDENGNAISYKIYSGEEFYL